ncbi:MAG: FixH family protein [Pyrinomonadaceae bacterium]|nr:FixH family protein [Pyrinomonadaceae bacterium]
MKNKGIIIGLTILLSVIVLASACGSGGDATLADMKKISDKKVSDQLTITLSNSDGKLKNGTQDLMLTFTDGCGKPVDISAAALNFNMPAMGTMSEMNQASKLSTTSTAGQFKGSVDISMAGEWTAQISYEGKETGKTTIPVTAY